MSLDNPTPEDLIATAKNLRAEGQISRADTLENVSKELLRLKTIEIEAMAVCKSYECYCAIRKPEKEWDDYDFWIYPLWIRLVKSLGVDILPMPWREEDKNE